MADGSSDRNSLAVVVTVLTLLLTVVGAALAFHGRVMADVLTVVTSELKHVVTREELAELRRASAEVEAERHVTLMRRLDQIDYQLKELRRRR